jgi:hypothetical protein
MWRFPFLIYCLACWEYFLFEPLIALNLQMIGYFRRATPRAASDFERSRRYRRDLYCPKAASPGLGLSGIEGCQHPNAPSVVRSL